MIVLVLAVPVVFLERLSLLPAIRRSTELIMRRGPTGFTLEAGWMRTTVIAFVMFIIYYLLIILSQLPLLILNVVAVFRAEPPTQTILGPQLVPLSILLPLQVVCAAIQGVFFAIIVIPWPLLYYDIRTRYEGLDLEAAAAELAASPAALEES
jgi:hypothetical protein